MIDIDLKLIQTATDESHHLFNGKPLYARRFNRVLKYHPPGYAPVVDRSGAYHIDINGNDFYSARYINSFGFYDNCAAVESDAGWFHIDIAGKPLYDARYAWCGNFQENACVVKNDKNEYFHINLKGERLYLQNYCYAGDFHEHAAVVRNHQGWHTHIDHSGNFLHGIWFLGLNIFHKGYACAKDQSGWFHINKQGKALYQNRFRSLGPFYNNVAHAENDKGEEVIIDQTGQTVSIIAKGYMNDDSLQELSADLVGFWKTQTIHAAVHIGILDFLPDEVSNIAQAINISEENCERLLKGLQELNIVSLEDLVWKLTVKGQLLVPSQTSAMVAAAKVWGDSHYHEWLHLADRLKGNDCYQYNYFVDLAKTSSELKNYHKALSVYAEHDYQAFIEDNDWQKHRVVIDAGGGAGTLLHHLLDVAPHLNGILIDLPSVVELSDGHHHPRAKYIGADLFSPWAISADAIIFARVLHDWDDEHAQRLLIQARNHLTRNGRIYILEMILSEIKPEGRLLDLNMLVMTGGKERTLSSWRALTENANLRIVESKNYSPVINALILEKTLD